MFPVLPIPASCVTSFLHTYVDDVPCVGLVIDVCTPAKMTPSTTPPVPESAARMRSIGANVERTSADTTKITDRRTGRPP